MCLSEVKDQIENLKENILDHENFLEDREKDKVEKIHSSEVTHQIENLDENILHQVNSLKDCEIEEEEKYVLQK